MNALPQEGLERRMHSRLAGIVHSAGGKPTPLLYREGAAETDGKTVTLSPLPDPVGEHFLEEWTDRRAAAAHEGFHLRYTRFDVLQPALALLRQGAMKRNLLVSMGLAHHVFNALEDARIERAGTARFAGVAPWLGAIYGRWLLGMLNEKPENRTPAWWAFFGLGLLCVTSRDIKQAGLPADVLEAIEKAAPYVEQARYAPATRGVVAPALEVLCLIAPFYAVESEMPAEALPNAGEAKPGERNEAQDATPQAPGEGRPLLGSRQISADSQQGEESLGEGQGGQGQKLRQPGNQAGEGSTGSPEPKNGADRRGGLTAEGQQAPEGQTEDTSGAGRQAGQANSTNSGTTEAAGGPGSGDAHGDAVRRQAWSQMRREAQAAVRYGAKDAAKELGLPDPQDAGSETVEATEASSGDARAGSVRRSVVPRLSAKDPQIEEILGHRVTVYRGADGEAVPPVSGLTGGVARLLRPMIERRADDPVHSLPRGALDPQAFWKVGVLRQLGDGEVFRRPGLPGYRTDMVAAILRDHSGSMETDDRYVAVAQASWLLREALQRLKVPTAVYGFHVGGVTENGQYRQAVRHEVLVDFEEHSSAGCLVACSDGTNADGLAIDFAARRLLARPEQVRVLIAMTDGLPTALQDPLDTAQRAARAARARGVNVIEVFLGEPGSQTQLEQLRLIYGRDVALCPDVGHLGTRLAKVLRLVLRSRLHH